MIPQTTTAARKVSKEANEMMAAATMVLRPAAGPLTLNCEPLKLATIIPPTIPLIIPENGGAPDARAIPKHSGRATRNTTIEEGKSYRNAPAYCFTLLTIIRRFFEKHMACPVLQYGYTLLNECKICIRDQMLF